ncbi:uncharacterized protein EV420DRAFT_915017 [Desarmillaria tabescens]|uniref:C3H1-type domain-containing protein n=1 Tax=Armillaria tabescens TaxID=1929756 RepID=A0AA39JQE2_ARMTA|nr:uncharacterized protein EV420DRAFT_915017 [Desarmillaria tabescens]KAK0446055.1 hypothetical protein EV420DRAFT_915017 [Desarmillaria tabescens]
MPVAGPSTMPSRAPAVRRDERAAGGRNIPPRLAKEPKYPPGLFNSAQDSNTRPTYQRLPSLSDNYTVPRAICPPKPYPPKGFPRYSKSQEICNNYLRGWCKWEDRCHRRHISPSEYRNYNPPPGKLPPPTRIEPESPPGLPKVRVNNRISDAA